MIFIILCASEVFVTFCVSQSDGPVLPRVTVRDPGSPGSSGAKLHRFCNFQFSIECTGCGLILPSALLIWGNFGGPLPQNG